MKTTALRTSLLAALFVFTGFLFYGCSGAAGTNSGSTSLTSSSSSPTQAYKDLYDAVKSGDMERIRSQMTVKTRELAEMTASRYQQPVEKVLANAFTTTVKAESLPTVREERIKETMGAVEVWDTESSSWQDVPFIMEDGGWKLAFGDMLAGSWKSPGDGRATRERKEANTALPQPTDNAKPMPSLPEAMKKMQNANVNNAANSNSAANVNSAAKPANN